MPSFNKQAALQAGYTEQQINEYLKKNDKRYYTDPKADDPFLTKFAKFFAAPAEKYARFAGEAVGQAGRFVTDPAFRKLVYGKDITREEADKLTAKKPTFFLKEEKLKDRKAIVETGARATAGAMSYAVPAGKTFKAAAGLGAVSGGLRAASEEDAGFGEIAGGVAAGGVAGGLFYGGGKAIQKGKEYLAKKGAASYTKATPSSFKKALEDHGIDIRAIARKYIPFKSSYDDLLGPASTRGRGGLIKETMDQAGEQIDDVLDIAGTNIKLSGDDVIESLEKEYLRMAGNLGEGTKRKALRKIVDEAKKKYLNGINAKEALKIVRYANSKFGKSVVETQKGAVATSAQKLEANTLRNVLKEMFPDLADGLRTQEELIILRTILNQARSKGSVAGFNFGKLDITRPGTLFDTILGSGAVSKGMMTLSGKAPKVPPLVPSVVGGIAAGGLKPEAAGPTFQGGEPAVGGETPDNQLTNQFVDQGMLPESQREVYSQQAGQQQAQQPVLSEKGQWRYDFQQSKWVPNEQGQEQRQGGMYSAEEFDAAMMNDLVNNNGKNVNKIIAAKKEIYPDDKKSTQVIKRELILNQSSLVIERVVEAALAAPAGMHGAFLSQVGKIPGVSGGEAEFLRRDIEAFARLIASAFASEVGVATDRDVERWLNMMPRPGDTMSERKRQIEKLVHQVKQEAISLGAEVPPAILNLEISGKNNDQFDGLFAQ